MRLFDRYRSEPVYNTRAVVQRTGIPADTLRAWERRYGIPNPPRTQGNQRLYSDRDIAIVNWLREQTQHGLTISQAVSLLRVDSREQGSDTPPVVETRSTDDAALHLDPSARRTQTIERLQGYRDRVVTSLITFDAASADRVVEEAIALVPVDDVCHHVLAAAMVDIGHKWQRGEIRIGNEHFSSSFVMRKLSTLFNLSQPQHGRGPIVAATVAGELHELGLLLTCLTLSRHGYRIVYLGPNMPEDELLVVIDDLHPPLVLLSSSSDLTVPALISNVKAIRDHAEQDPTIMPAPAVGYGGRVFLEKPELRQHVAGCFLGATERDVLTAVDRIFAATPAGWAR